MNKKLVFMAVIFSVCIVGLGAQGWGGGPGGRGGYGFRGRGGWGGSPGVQGWGYGNGGFQSEESINGNIAITNGIPTLESHLLVLPGQVVLKDGDAVEARGFANGNSFVVTWIKVNDVEYAFGGVGGGPGQGGYGFGYCYGGGYGGGRW